MSGGSRECFVSEERGGKVKVAVLGLGAVGVQVLWNLSQTEGVEAVGYDSLYPGHPFAGAGGESRLYRNFELSDLAYMPIIRRADELWNRLEQACGRSLRRQTGVLLLGGSDNQQMKQALKSSEESDKPYELLSHSELRSQFPQFSLDSTDVGMWDKEGGVISPELTIALTANLAIENGATVHEHSRVRRIESRDDGVRIHTQTSFMDYDRVVVACGGWTSTLMPELKTEVVVKRLTSAWFLGKDEHSLSRLPPFMRTAPTYCYGVPTPDGQSVKLGLGFNDHLSVGNPDDVSRELIGQEAMNEIDRFDWIVRDLLPSVMSKPIRMNTYIESYTRSMHEYIRFHPHDSNIAVLTGFSGHGFKISPAVGEIGAQMITVGTPELDIDFLREAPPEFSISNINTGETTHNPLVSSDDARK